MASAKPPTVAPSPTHEGPGRYRVTAAHVVMTGNKGFDEWRDRNRTGQSVEPHSDTEVLERSVVRAVVNVRPIPALMPMRVNRKRSCTSQL